MEGSFLRLSRVFVFISPHAKSRGGQASGKIAKDIAVKLFEFDPRFEVFGDDFVAYDFQQPLRGLPPQLKGAFDRVLIDPPFLSEDCQTKSISLSPCWGQMLTMLSCIDGALADKTMDGRIRAPNNAVHRGKDEGSGVALVSASWCGRHRASRVPPQQARERLPVL